MRTIAAFAAQNPIVEKYNQKLEEARKLGQKKGFITGVSFGAVMGLFFLTWALGMFIVYFMLKKIERNKSSNKQKRKRIQTKKKEGKQRRTKTKISKQNQNKTKQNKQNKKLDIKQSSKIIGLWYGSTLIAAGEYQIGDVITIFFSVIIGAFALGQAAPSFEAMASAQVILFLISVFLNFVLVFVCLFVGVGFIHFFFFLFFVFSN
jgi:hypothetical protein